MHVRTPLFALIPGLLCGTAIADLEIDDLITVNGFAYGGIGDAIWGSHAVPDGRSDNGLPHPFGGISAYVDDLIWSEVNVTSDEIDPPPDGKKFAGIFHIEFTEWFRWEQHQIDILGIKEMGNNYINEVWSSAGIASTDGANLFIDVSSAELDISGGYLKISWTQVPGPGGLALLALGAGAGMTTRRRRRAPSVGPTSVPIGSAHEDGDRRLSSGPGRSHIALLVGLSAMGLALASGSVRADIVRKGEACVPGFCGKVVNWTARYRKTPGTARGVHFWFDVELKNAQPNEQVEFVVCAMLNVNKKDKCQPAYIMKIIDNQWSCSRDESEDCPNDCNGGPQKAAVCWYPNYHFGCRTVVLNLGNGHSANVFDEQVELKVAFKEKDLVAPYLDFLIKCPNGVDPTCVVLNQGGNNFFLTPGDDNFPQPFNRRPGDLDGDCDVDAADLLILLANWGPCPPPPAECPADLNGDGNVGVADLLILLGHWGWSDGTSSWWIVTGGELPEPSSAAPDAASVHWEGAWNTGNWYTMGYRDNVYECLLRGVVTDAPAGATLEFELPSSTGGGVVQYVVGGSGCLGEPVEVEIPFVITEDLMFDEDENTYLRVIYADDVCSEYPTGEIIEFQGEVMATNDTFLPNGEPLFRAGTFMHGIHVQFLGDHDLPFLKSQELIQIDADHYELGIVAGDKTTMAIGATVGYSVDGVPQGNLAMPYDDPAEEEGATRFRVTLPAGPCSTIDYRIFLVDDASNVSETEVFHFDCPMAASSPSRSVPAMSAAASARARAATGWTRLGIKLGIPLWE